MLFNFCKRKLVAELFRKSECTFLLCYLLIIPRKMLGSFDVQTLWLNCPCLACTLPARIMLFHFINECKKQKIYCTCVFQRQRSLDFKGRWCALKAPPQTSISRLLLKGDLFSSNYYRTSLSLQ